MTGQAKKILLKNSERQWRNSYDKTGILQHKGRIRNIVNGEEIPAMRQGHAGDIPFLQRMEHDRDKRVSRQKGD